MSDDPEYDDLVRQEKRAMRILKRSHYRAIDCSRCETCAAFRSGSSCEDEDQCADAMGDGHWVVGTVHTNGVCDNWRAKERKLEEASE
jgi:hypothetical protein